MFIRAGADIKAGTLTLESIPLKTYSLSMEYEIGTVKIAAEHLWLGADLDMPGFDEIKIRIEGCYGSINWQMAKWLSVAASYGEHFPDTNDKEGKTFTAIGMPDYYAWQKDLALSTRLNITESWNVKFEFHILSGTGLCDLENNQPKENWTLVAVKTGLSF